MRPKRIWIVSCRVLYAFNIRIAHQENMDRLMSCPVCVQHQNSTPREYGSSHIVSCMRSTSEQHTKRIWIVSCRVLYAFNIRIAHQENMDRLMSCPVCVQHQNAHQENMDRLMSCPVCVQHQNSTPREYGSSHVVSCMRSTSEQHTKRIWIVSCRVLYAFNIRIAHQENMDRLMSCPVCVQHQNSTPREYGSSRVVSCMRSTSEQHTKRIWIVSCRVLYAFNIRIAHQENMDRLVLCPVCVQHQNSTPREYGSSHVVSCMRSTSEQHRSIFSWCAILMLNAYRTQHETIHILLVCYSDVERIQDTT